MSARIPVSGILASGQGELTLPIAAEVDLGSFEGDSISLLEPLQGEIQCRNEGRLIVVWGTLKTKVEVRCSRCLEPVAIPLTVDYREAFFREGEWDLVKNIARNLGFADDDEVHPFKGDAIDLSQSLAATVVLSLPMKVLCRDDCRGLCPTCGANLNQGNCNCNREEIDPRLATLRQLLNGKLKTLEGE